MSWERRFRPHGYELPSPLTPPRAARLPTGPGMEGAPIPISEGTCGATESPVMLTFPRAQGLILAAERTLGGQGGWPEAPACPVSYCQPAPQADGCGSKTKLWSLLGKLSQLLARGTVAQALLRRRNLPRYPKGEIFVVSQSVPWGGGACSLSGETWHLLPLQRVRPWRRADCGCPSTRRWWGTRQDKAWGAGGRAGREG